MESLILFNVGAGLISNCAVGKNEETEKTYFEWLKDYNINGNIIIQIDGDWRDFTNKQLVAKCDEIIISICKSRLGDD